MPILAIAALLVGLGLAGFAGLRSEHYADRLLDEVNAKTEPKLRYPAFGANWYVWKVLERHRRLYPGDHSTRRTFYRWSMLVPAGTMLFIAALFWFRN